MSDDDFRYRSTLDHGVLELSVPRTLSQFDVDEVEGMFALIVRQMRRRELPDSAPASAASDSLD